MDIATRVATDILATGGARAATRPRRGAAVLAATKMTASANEEKLQAFERLTPSPSPPGIMAAIEEQNAAYNAVAPATPAKKRGRKSQEVVPKQEHDEAAFAPELAAGVEEDNGISEEEEEKPRKKRARKAKTTPAPKTEDVDEEVAADGEETPKKKRTRKPKVVLPKEGEEGYDPDAQETPKKKRTRKPKEPEVYVIPPVERQETTYKGRLGYACLNTIMRKQKPPVFCSRTCRIDTIKKEGMDYLKELGRQNMADLKTLIEWNAAHHIYFMRMSSEMFPFAAHPDYQYSLDYAEKELKEAGEAANRLGVRLTTHPGQFTQLGSPREVVVENAIRDLTYHTEMMDRMGLGKDSVMIIHGGGVYGDKETAIANVKKNFKRLPKNVQDRLVMENDEICYNADEILGICEELNIPFVFDYHHDWIYPSAQTPAEMMPRIIETWTRRGIKPKQHLSEPRKGAETIMERRAHADRCQRLPEALPDDVDLMIEAKDKEQAVFHLFRIYDLHPTIYEDLRPPAEEETLHTNGRKSSKSKAKAAIEKEEKRKAAMEGMEDEQLGGDEEDMPVPVDEDGVEASQEGGVPNEMVAEKDQEPAPLPADLVEAMPEPAKKRVRKAKQKGVKQA